MLVPVQRELALPFAAGAPAKAADPSWVVFFFSSKWLHSGGNESMTLLPPVLFLWAPDSGQLFSLLWVSSPAEGEAGLQITCQVFIMDPKAAA